jgi:hypothetical protein
MRSRVVATNWLLEVLECARVICCCLSQLVLRQWNLFIGIRHHECYKNICCWPLSISLLIPALYLYPEDFACIHMHYLFWLVILSPYLFWLYSLWSFPPAFVLYLLTGHPAHSPIPFPLYRCSPYYILNPIPYYQSMTLSPLPLPHPWSVTQSPVTFTIVSVCDSISPLPLPYHQSLTHFLSLTFSCTTTYSLVCACFLHLLNPTYHKLYSLTWIYLVLPGCLVHNLLSLISLCLWSSCFTLTLGHRVLDLSEAFIVIPYNSGYSYRWLQDSTAL